MAYTFLGHTEFAATGNASATSGSQNTSGADLIVVCCASWQNAGVPNQIQDSQGGGNNTWSDALAAATDGASYMHIAYTQAPAHVGSGHTFTIQNPDGGYPSAIVMWFSGSASSPVDQTNGTTFSSNASPQPGSITPGSANELIIAALSLNASLSGNAPTVNQSFLTPAKFNDFSSGNNFGSAASYLIQGSAAAVNPTFSLFAADGGVIQIASFKAGAGGPAFIAGRPLEILQAVNRASTY